MVLQPFPEARFDPQETLAELVLRHPECARVLQKHNLEFCCDGELPLGQACVRRLLSVDQVIAELEGVASLSSSQPDPRRLSLHALLSALEHRHAELALGFPGLAEKARTLAALSPRRPWLKELAWDLRDLTDALLPHLDAEATLFRRSAEATGAPPPLERLGRLGLEQDHAELGEIVADLHLSLDPFREAPDTRPEERRLFAELDALEGELMQTAHLENHLLPRRPREAQAPARPITDGASTRSDEACAPAHRQTRVMERPSPHRPEEARKSGLPPSVGHVPPSGQWDISPGETLLADGRRDLVLEASMESFPASDPPARY